MVTQYVHFFTRNIIFEIHAVKCFCLRTVIFTPYNNCQAICVVSIIYISPVQIGFRKIDLSRTISIVCNMCNVINLRFRSPHGRRTCYSHSIHSSCGGKIIFRRHVRILLARFPDLNLGHVKFHPVFIPCIICIFYTNADIHTRHSAYQGHIGQTHVCSDLY